MTTTTNPSGRVGRLVVDDGLAWILAALAAAGSFTHIRDLALRSGQHGWMADAIAVCIDLMCVMAVRERKRDQRLGRPCSRVSWPTVVLTMGICLTIAANLASAQPTPWGWIVAATPAGTFLIAVSMLERRGSVAEQCARTAPQGYSAGVTDPRPAPSLAGTAVTGPETGHMSADITPDTAAVMVGADGLRDRRRSTTIEVRARSVLARRPDVTGADLGRMLGVSERHGRRLRNRLTPVGA